MAKIIGGLQKTEQDNRDFSLGKITRLPAIEDLPRDFSLTPLSTKDQLDTDFCTAFATCGMSELQEEVELAPEFSFASSKEISGDPDAWGQSIRTALKAHIEYGALTADTNPYTVYNTDNSILRRLSTWGSIHIDYAKKHKKKSYFKVTGSYDDFDNIRASIFRFKKEKQAVAIGLNFGWDLNQKILSTKREEGIGHCMYVIGWREMDNETYLIVQNSYGVSAGVGGKHYVTRDVINDDIRKYGAYMMIDIENHTAKKYLSKDIKIEDNRFVRLLKLITSIFLKTS